MAAHVSRAHGPARAVAVCTPAARDAERSGSLLRAARAAGLEPESGLVLVDGLVAIAEAARRAGLVGDRGEVVVCDIGERGIETGRIRLDVLARGGDQAVTTAVVGDPVTVTGIGGESLDAALAAHLLETLGRSANDQEAPSAALLLECRRARTDLERAESTSVSPPPGSGDGSRFTFLRADLETAAAPLLTWTVDAVTGALSAGPATAVVLAGGACGTPGLRGALDGLGVRVVVPASPRNAAAHGAAWLAAGRAGVLTGAPATRPGVGALPVIARPPLPPALTQPVSLAKAGAAPASGSALLPLQTTPLSATAAPLASWTSVGAPPAVGPGDRDTPDDAASTAIIEPVRVAGPRAGRSRPDRRRVLTALSLGALAAAVIFSVTIATAVNGLPWQSSCAAASGPTPWICVVSATRSGDELVVGVVGDVGSNSDVLIEIFGSGGTHEEGAVLRERASGGTAFEYNTRDAAVRAAVGNAPLICVRLVEGPDGGPGPVDCKAVTYGPPPAVASVAEPAPIATAPTSAPTTPVPGPTSTAATPTAVPVLTPTRGLRTTAPRATRPPATTAPRQTTRPRVTTTTPPPPVTSAPSSPAPVTSTTHSSATTTTTVPPPTTTPPTTTPPTTDPTTPPPTSGTGAPGTP
jgi:hypothetical protein